MSASFLLVAVVLCLLSAVRSKDNVCLCGPGYAKCVFPGGENFDVNNGGCGGEGKICADICPDDVGIDGDSESNQPTWKKVYRAAFERGQALQGECGLGGDPTKKWGESWALQNLKRQQLQRQRPRQKQRRTSSPSSSSSSSSSSSFSSSSSSSYEAPPLNTEIPPTPRFAIAFAGGLRTFALAWHSWEANVIEPSGGAGNFDLFFHVWHDENTHRSSTMSKRGVELATSLPGTIAFVGESFQDHLKLLLQPSGVGGARQKEHHSHSAMGAGNRSSAHRLVCPGGSGGNEEDEEDDEEDEVLPSSLFDNSWLAAVMADRAEQQRPAFDVGPTHSQWRKVHLALELVRRHEKHLVKCAENAKRRRDRQRGARWLTARTDGTRGLEKTEVAENDRARAEEKTGGGSTSTSSKGTTSRGSEFTGVVDEMLESKGIIHRSKTDKTPTSFGSTFQSTFGTLFQSTYGAAH